MSDTTTKEPEDLRREILAKIIKRGGSYAYMDENVYDGEIESILIAFDEYFEARSMELLEYMAENEVECYVNPIERKAYFLYNKELYTKEQLFENFL